jgi:hypothetical protein
MILCFGGGDFAENFLLRKRFALFWRLLLRRPFSGILLMVVCSAVGFA